MSKSEKVGNWADTFKALGLRCLSYGKFWQLCFTSIALMGLWKLNPSDIPKILQMLLDSKSVQIGGWLLFAGSTTTYTLVLRFMRTRYLSEIDRLVVERDRLQERLGGGNVAHSKLSERQKGL